MKIFNIITKKEPTEKYGNHVTNNEVNEKGELTREISTKIKGFAILLMVLHHSFGFPEYYTEGVSYPAVNILGKSSFYWICMITKICVAIFAFLTGYAYFYNKNQNLKYSIKKIVQLLNRYWIILFIIIIPLVLVCNKGNLLDTKQIFLSMFGLENNLELFGWYVYFYIGVMLILPFIKYIVTDNKFWNFLFLFSFGIVTWSLSIYIRTFPNAMTMVIGDLLYYFPCVFCGYLIAKHQSTEKIRKYSGAKKIWQCVLIIVVILMLRVYTANKIFVLNLDMIYAPIIVSMLTFIFNKNTKVGKCFYFLGLHSTNLWFLHSIFFSELLRDKTQVIAYLPHNPILVVTWIIVLCLPLSFLVNQIIKYEAKLFKKVHI